MRFLFLLGAFLLLFSCAGNKQISQNTAENNTPSSEIHSEPKIILALGDSLTAGYGLDISESYPTKLESKLRDEGYDYTIINAGISGDTSKGLGDRAELYLNKNPDIVLIVIGGNDGLRSLPTQELEKNIQGIIDIFAGKSKVVLAGMDIPANFGLKYRKDFQQVYKTLAKNNKEIEFLPSFLEDVAGDVRLNQADRIHPTSEGYDIIVENLYNFFQDKKILKK